ncbi:hypothetical protein R6242_01550 [Iodobacter sp. CM08]|uniref:hypothetical protein n=1 Tax=Iodobacter sp. CM08 TaxID=3085902 RepID=UPI00298183C8|nr:hypothetical protein [Iodobacter sp. CM08]MDW5415249.1 hypothetical protein [Iodobacter sp. CM08]
MMPIFCPPERFQLKSVTQAIIEKPVQRKSLIRRIEESGIFDISDEKMSSGGRLALLYALKPAADLVNFGRNVSL